VRTGLGARASGNPPPNKRLKLPGLAVPLQHAVSSGGALWRRSRNRSAGPQLKRDPLDGGNRHLEIAANFASKVLIDLTMSRNCRDLTACSVRVHCMPFSLSEQFTAVRLEVPNQVAALHPAILRGSRITFAVPTSSRANARLLSSTSSTASRRFSLASSRLPGEAPRLDSAPRVERL
jgi:hypothetical protein